MIESNRADETHDFFTYRTAQERSWTEISAALWAHDPNLIALQDRMSEAVSTAGLYGGDADVIRELLIGKGIVTEAELNHKLWIRL